MKGSFRVVRVAGTEVRIHLTFVLFLIWLGLGQYLASGGEAAARGVAFVLVLFGCVLLHEFGHALAARRFGIRTPDITLLPIGGVARLERIPEKPMQELVVALAGPMVNVVIVLFLLVMRRSEIQDWEALGKGRGDMVTQLLAVNISLVLFNMIPAFPMDGGRVFRALLSLRVGRRRATWIAARLGQVLAVVLGLGAIWPLQNPLLVLVAAFVYLGAAQEYAATIFAEARHTLTAADVMDTGVCSLPEGASLNDAVVLLLGNSGHEFPLLTCDGRLCGVLTREGVVEALERMGPESPAMLAISRELPVIRMETPLGQILDLMHRHRSPAIPVVDAAGRLLGLVSRDKIAAWCGMPVATG